MAIDTAEKRRSASGVPFLPLGPGVTPNATKDHEWRQQVGWGYSGIVVAIPAPDCFEDTLSLMRDTAVATSSTMSDAAIETVSAMRDTLETLSLMRDTAVDTSTSMSDAAVETESELC